jgi:pyridoxal phosphate enzyme (YggS family)
VFESNVASIRERFQQVQDQIAEAALEAGRNPGEIHLVVVTKSQPVEVVRAAIRAGASVLGENYAEEAVEKIAALGGFEVEWHMIGHVQSRKADLVARHFTMLHSLDSVKLAGRLDRACGEVGRILPVLLELNVSGEDSKYGLPAWSDSQLADLLPVIEAVSQFQHLKVHGLMTMPPFFEDGERSRPYFRRLRKVQDRLEKEFPKQDWSDLSMGTSVDFRTAITEGATYVRIGQAILGPRPDHH